MPVFNAINREALNVPNVKGVQMEMLVSGDTAPNFALRKFTISPNSEMPLHTNLVEHSQYVLRGSASVQLGSEEVEVREGDSLFIAAGLPHSYRAGEAGFEFICVVPNKSDQIKFL